jgi:hypothetical protein
MDPEITHAEPAPVTRAVRPSSVVVMTCLLGLPASWIIDVAPSAELFLAHGQDRGTEDQHILADGAVGVAPGLAGRPGTPEQSAVRACGRAASRHCSAQQGRCRDPAASRAPPPAARTNRGMSWTGTSRLWSCSAGHPPSRRQRAVPICRG